MYNEIVKFEDALSYLQFLFNLREIFILAAFYMLLFFFIKILLQMQQ